MSYDLKKNVYSTVGTLPVWRLSRLTRAIWESSSRESLVPSYENQQQSLRFPEKRERNPIRHNTGIPDHLPGILNRLTLRESGVRISYLMFRAAFLPQK